MEKKTKFLMGLIILTSLIGGCAEKSVEEPIKKIIEEKLTEKTAEEVPVPSEEPKETEEPEIETKEEIILPETNKSVIKPALPEMVLILGGTFNMGGERFFWEDRTEWPSEETTYDERPIHEVSLDPFYLSKYETTNKQFKEFVDDTGYVTSAEEDRFCETLIAEGMNFEEEKVEGTDWQHPLTSEDDISDRLDHPVACVSWIDAINYLNWLSEKENFEPAYFYNDDEEWELKPDASGYRLPTEAEWEYAAIGSNEKVSFRWLSSKKKFWIFPWGNPGENVKYGEHMNIYQLARYPDQSVYTAPIGSFPATGYGLYDMAGNIAEWVSDWYSDEYYQHSIDNNIIKNPLGPESGFDKVHRGGSWVTCECWARTTDRAGVNYKKAHNYIGFRVAKNLD